MEINQIFTQKGFGMEIIQIVLTLIALIGIGMLHILIRKTLSSYASEKGKNLATKEDITEITDKIESTKIALQQRDRIEFKKYELKYKSCIKALLIVDAQISHVVKNDNDGNPINVDKQYATAEEIRTCHNELILTLDNSEILNKFLVMVTGKSKNILTDLEALRELIRAELGFHGLPHKHDEMAWIGVSALKQE